jgi:hypothetical protein
MLFGAALRSSCHGATLHFPKTLNKISDYQVQVEEGSHRSRAGAGVLKEKRGTTSSWHRTVIHQHHAHCTLSVVQVPDV